LNRLLQRQISKVFGTTPEIPEQYNEFIDLINRTYNQNDSDHKMLERILDVTSREMLAVNRKLKEESEHALSLADIRLKSATTAANVGIWEVNLETEEVIWNDTTYLLYGIDPRNSKLDGAQAWKKYVHPDDQISADTQYRLAIEGKIEFDIEYKVIWPDDSIRFLRTKGTVVRDTDGKPIKIVGTKWDITERKKAEENLLREKLLAESMINSLPGIFFLFTKEGKFLRWNKNLSSITGYTDEEIEKMNPMDFFAEDEKEYIKNEIIAVLTNGQSDTEAHLLTKDKRKLPYYFNSIKINYHGEDCIIGTTIDISKRRKAEENLKAKNKDLEEFAYIVSHDLRAPIAKIQGISELINQNTVSEETKNLLGYIKEEVKNIDNIIKEMNSIIRDKDYINSNVVFEKKLPPFKIIKNVFLIDDDPIVNILSKKIIEKINFCENVYVYRQASEALDELKKIEETEMHNCPDIIFLDINMPEMNGWEFLDNCKKACPGILKKCSVIMLTSSIDPRDKQKSQSYDFVTDFISKPLTKEKLKNLFN